MQFFWSHDTQAVRVSPAGQVLDPARISVFKFDSSSSTEAAVAADGTVLDPEVVVFVPGTFSLTFNLDLAFAVDEYLLTYVRVIAS